MFIPFLCACTGNDGGCNPRHLLLTTCPRLHPSRVSEKVSSIYPLQFISSSFLSPCLSLSFFSFTIPGTFWFLSLLRKSTQLHFASPHTLSHTSPSKILPAPTLCSYSYSLQPPHRPFLKTEPRKDTRKCSSTADRACAAPSLHPASSPPSPTANTLAAHTSPCTMHDQTPPNSAQPPSPPSSSSSC